MSDFSRKLKVDFAALHKRADNLLGRLPAVSRRRRLSRAAKILKIAGGVFLLLVILLAVLSLSQLTSLKLLIGQSLMGKNNLEQALVFARQDDFSSAAELAGRAENNFNLALTGLNGLEGNFLFKHAPFIGGQLSEAENLLAAAQLFSKAAAGGANFGLYLESALGGDKKLNFSRFTAREKRAVLEKIYQSAPELNGIKADLDLAAFNLERVRAAGALYLAKNQINLAKAELDRARQMMSQAVPLSQLLPALSGYPAEANFLVILENPDELRPAGGFVGTYGLLRVKDGDITDFVTHDIYHLDMPLERAGSLDLEPPAPIKKYLVSDWYMRDANWSPDWPTSARELEWFYRTESKLNQEIAANEKNLRFDGIIALTPRLITDFLDLTGPIEIEGQSYTSANFTNLLEYRVEKGYVQLGVTSWQRKEVIGEIAKELKIRLFNLPPERWSGLAAALFDNLSAKNLLFYFSDSQLENLAMDNGWAGEIKNQPGDYLYVVDANLGALKTDAVMKRGLSYDLCQSADGLYASLKLNYAHSGRTDWRTGTYKSYTRVYAPAGSRFISLSGYDPKQVDTGQEAGKTWFGFFLTVEPGQIASLELKYRLPAEIMDGGYGLYLQKQAGKELSEVRVDFSFLNEIKSYSPTGLAMEKTGPKDLSWQGDLNLDKSFKVNF